MEDTRMLVGVWDYVVLTIVMILCTIVGLYCGRQKKVGRAENIEHYLMGGRKMHFLPIAFSILATNISSVSIAGVVTEMYLFGVHYVLAFFAYSFGIIPVAEFIIPIIRKHQYVSIYEYLEKRFDKKLRLIFSVSYLVGTMVFLGVVLYIPAVSMTIVSGLPTYLTVLSIGASCTVYCVFGGFQGVVMADVLQSILLLSTMILFVVKGTFDAGGIYSVYESSLRNGYLHIMSWYENLDYRHSVTSVVCMGFYYSLKDIILNQSGAQRLMSLKNTQDAKRSSYLTFLLTLFFSTLLALCGIVMYVNFYECNPLLFPAASGVTSMDQLFIYATVKFLRNWPGMSGLALSGILCASISTLSSYINAFAAITLEDYMKRFCPTYVETQERQVFVCRVFTGVYGCVAIAFAFLIPLMGGAVKAAISTLAVTAGPMCGILLLGMFCKRANSKAAFISLWIGVVICLTLQIGNLIARPYYETTNLSFKGCAAFFNESLDGFHQYNVSGYDGMRPKKTKTCPLFRISFVLYGPIGLVTAWLSGYLISFLYEKREVDETLLSSLVTNNTRKPRETVNDKLLGDRSAKLLSVHQTPSEVCKNGHVISETKL